MPKTFFHSRDGGSGSPQWRPHLQRGGGQRPQGSSSWGVSIRAREDPPGGATTPHWSRSHRLTAMARYLLHGDAHCFGEDHALGRAAPERLGVLRLRESDRPDDVDASRKAGDSWWEESCEREIGRGRSLEGIMVWPRCHASTPQGPRTRTQAEPTPHGRTVLARTSSVLPWQELVHQPSRFV